VTGLEGDDVQLAALLRAEEVGEADAVAVRLARGDEPLEHRLAVSGSSTTISLPSE
jgi:hypothetical protein